MRLEDPRLLKGQGRYLDDIALPGMLHAAFLRSQSAHARINGIDISAARETPGVAAIYTAKDLEAIASGPLPQLAPHPALKQPVTYHPLAVSEVCHVGVPMAIALAGSRHCAEDAAYAIAASLEELPAVADARRAAEQGAPAVHTGSGSNIAGTLHASFGDVEQVFQSADHVLKESFALHRGGCHATECRGVIANYDERDDLLTVWSSTQAPYVLRRI